MRCSPYCLWRRCGGQFHFRVDAYFGFVGTCGLGSQLVVQLVLAVKAYQGGTVKLPLLGDWTDKIIKKV